MCGIDCLCAGREVCAGCGQGHQVKVGSRKLLVLVVSGSICYNSELEECLLVMPFDQMVEFLQLTDYWLEVALQGAVCVVALFACFHREDGRWNSPVAVYSSY